MFLSSALCFTYFFVLITKIDKTATFGNKKVKFPKNESQKP